METKRLCRSLRAMQKGQKERQARRAMQGWKVTQGQTLSLPPESLFGSDFRSHQQVEPRPQLAKDAGPSLLDLASTSRLQRPA